MPSARTPRTSTREYSRHVRIECEEVVLDLDLNLGGQRCGALLDFRPLRHDTESAVGVYWQHSRATSFELEFKMKVRKKTTCGRKVACTCGPLVDAGTLVWQGKVTGMSAVAPRTLG
jgi:hypothetical protein